MATKRTLWFALSSSLWFVPGLLLLGSIATALGLITADARWGAKIIDRWPWVLSAGPSGARAILQAIATSMITIAGVSFSITIVTLSLASNQYSSRVLRFFMRDRVNQYVLGVFVSVFAYSILVLQAVRSETDPFVPQLAVTFGIFLALVGIGFFVVFIHHTAVTIQAPEIVARISEETVAALRTASKDADSGETATAATNDLDDATWQRIASGQSGYIQDVQLIGLFELARKHDTTFRVLHAIGDFVVAGRPLLEMVSPTAPDEKLIACLRDHFGINTTRTIEQDAAFGIRQIVDIALKALSPSLNDTTTAIHCIDHLGVVLHEALQLPRPATHRFEGRNLRLIVQQPDVPAFVDIALHEIRQNSRSNVAVTLRLLRLLDQLFDDRCDAAMRRSLNHHLQLIDGGAAGGIPSASDRADVARRVQRLRETHKL